MQRLLKNGANQKISLAEQHNDGRTVSYSWRNGLCRLFLDGNKKESDRLSFVIKILRSKGQMAHFGSSFQSTSIKRTQGTALIGSMGMKQLQLKREYASFREAVIEVHRQKDRSDKEAFHRAIKTESLNKTTERHRFISETAKIDKETKRKYNANISDRS